MKARAFGLSIAIFIISIGLTDCFAKANEKILLRRKFEKGKAYSGRWVTERKTTEVFKGREYINEQKISIGWEVDVNDVDKDGNAWIVNKVTTCKISQRGDKGFVEYDSTKNNIAQAVTAQKIAVAIGEPYLLEVTSHYNITGFKGLDAARENMIRKVPEGPSKQAVVDYVKKRFSDKAVKEIVESVMMIYPEEPVGLGDSWSKSFVMSYYPPVIIKKRFTLKQRNNGVAVIEIESDIRPNLKAEPTRKGYFVSKSELSGSESGLIKVKESTGQIIFCELKLKLSGQVKTRDMVNGTEDMIMYIKSDSVSTTERTERK